MAAVNDPPRFTPGPGVSVAEDCGPYTAPWATAIAPGPADETAQAVAFEVVWNSQPSLFETPPSVDTSGVLSFTPAPDAFGVAAIEVRLVDDGGTAGGGEDGSDLVAFSVSVSPVNDPPWRPTMLPSAGGTCR